MTMVLTGYAVLPADGFIIRRTHLFVTRAFGGVLRGSEEGIARDFPITTFPAISPNRVGSRRTMQAFLSYLEGL